MSEQPINARITQMVSLEDLVITNPMRKNEIALFKKEFTANPLKMDNVVTMPHIGSATQETRYKMGVIAVQNLVQGLNGEEPVNQIHKE
ncbi:hypothetical protein [Lentibacillus amyloliquefaciens]|uniref:D-isomer specific 2-hydroxyacid dehydrogenase NAD-binding domain-containing protein n=1 Tax=Lentibacillus amyloliquefaciens TaxID=1472767 RepID=A0A0U4EI53_9BACI|nr:hypothetical protein [Lentibacillus amyloliquefaciens]ALX50153.1 hypothetical protein AOX59_17165 [Lentibacillus amyloliquefaciens]